MCGDRSLAYQLADGFTLTCVAYPTSDVTIKTHKKMSTIEYNNSQILM